MAESIVADTLANPDARKMDAREYIDFLTQLERVGWRLPADTRAYLVTLQASGERVVQAVHADCSVLNLDKELVTHMKEAMVSTETLLALREVCTQRLTDRGHSPRLMDLEGEQGERATKAWAAAVEIQQDAQAVRDLIDCNTEPAECNRVVDTLLRRIKELAGVAISCVDDDDTLENLRERLGEE